MGDIKSKILQISEEFDLFIKENYRSFILKCPSCGKEKLYVDKEHGNFICFSGSCGIKGQAPKLISIIKGISYEEAIRELYGKKEFQPKSIIDLSQFLEQEKEYEDNKVTSLPIIEIPKHFYNLDDIKSIDGLNYLKSRNISLQIAQKYDIMYSPIYRRVIFPIKDINNNYIGYQARAIDDVPKAERMRNNTGFRKGKTFMFLNCINDCNHVIVAEGPVDAIKFDKCGGNIASLGKEISNDQLNVLNNLNIDKVYWALDDDAHNLIPKYAEKIDKKSYIITIPENARNRILSTGKTKVDFGECTYDECLEAFNLAQPIGGKIFI